MDNFTDEELAYIQLAVRRMAPLAHRPEAALFNSCLDKLREEELRRKRDWLEEVRMEVQAEIDAEDKGK